MVERGGYDCFFLMRVVECVYRGWGIPTFKGVRKGVSIIDFRVPGILPVLLGLVYFAGHGVCGGAGRALGYLAYV